MKIGIPHQSVDGSTLVAATPKTVEALTALGYDVLVETGAGQAATLGDEAYLVAGAAITDAASVWGADIVAAYQAPTASQRDLLAPGAVLICTLAPHTSGALIADLAARGVTAMALDAVPRISRAQSMDVLSTMSNVSGYRAVIEAAQAYGAMFAGQVTAAGKTNPATVFVIGAGVAGLASLGAAVSLGAQVRAFDVRPEVAEQIESMGARFVHAPAAQQEVSADGYAKPLTEAQLAAALDVYAQESARADVVITTALVRGSAPTTITAQMVAAMKPGSVIVDLAASGGGNCELTVPGEAVLTDNGVHIIGYTDLPSRMPQHTSQLLGTNIVNLVKLLTPAKDGAAVLDMEDPIVRGMTVAHAGEVTWPPPPVSVSADAGSGAVGNPSETEGPQEREARLAAEAERASALEAARKKRNAWSIGIAGGALAIALCFANPAFLMMMTVFILAVFIGYYVISSVSHSLHTPLMSQTNAISGIILIGALLQLGSSSLVVTVLAFIAAAVASINVFGGFLVTYRMLGMFQKGA
ncbi:Re/Si-specific NAD(P)(+) transhydrogenase subunit alpha [Demequina globuliformis]|uniref:Re/Si-specific NAD(P)(+) transhydrogenase subunit alpha n=1 Tax=Demequina globuliformis TaxID=676202 RepID=UPI000780ABA3|nr:Re/Si-specific NAD(P)(+) transhydrogenase subunit alpha [Demequina globuliformis]